MTDTTPLRAVIYARYSSDLQRAASIEDQTRVCKTLIETRGWRLAQVYSDMAISGATHMRPGFQQMQQDARAGSFDVLVAEGLDRLSRDQEHIAALQKLMLYAQIPIVTVAEGEISELHIGLKGTMSALYLKDLAQKTHRGLEGRVHAGKSAGGISYGYRLDRQPLADGTFTTGERTIDPVEAETIREIFTSYVRGESARALAMRLNKAGVPAPRAKTWTASTISGNWKRGTGILNNELYIGKLVWNRQKFVKDPETGKRQARPNPPEAWIIEEVPDLRIIDDDLWEAVKQRQGATRKRVLESPRRNGFGLARRPTYLFSGVLKCSCCGAGYTLMNKVKYGCSAARNRGTCENRALIHREEVERRILDALKDKLLHPDLVAEFVAEYQREWNRLKATQTSERAATEHELKTLTPKIDQIVEAIAEGMFSPALKAKLEALESRKAELEAKLATLAPQDAPIRLHPGLADVYRRKVADLTAALNHEATRSEAAECIRGLVSEIRLIPDPSAPGGHQIELHGDLAAILALGEGKSKTPRGLSLGASDSLVAGTRNRRNLLRGPGGSERKVVAEGSKRSKYPTARCQL